MHCIEFGQAKTKVSEDMVGLMRIDQMSVAKVTELVETAFDEGINALDIADVYGRGAYESLLGEVFAANPGLRDRVILQSKVGIRKEEDGFTWYDFSKEHIIEAVDASLSRLGVDHADSMLLQTCHIDGEMPLVERAIVCARSHGMKRAKAMAMRSGSNAPSVAHVSAAPDVPYQWKVATS